jgi:hypothetical protein
LTIVVDRPEAVINFTGGENEAIFLGVGYYILQEVIFLLCHRGAKVE